MAGPGTNVGGPLLVGSTAANSGSTLLNQTVTLVASTTNAVSATMTVPPNTQIVDFTIDTTTAWNSATSDTLTIGTVAGGTQYVGAIDTKAAASRLRPTYTGPQLLAMSNTAGNTAVVVTVTPVGSAAAGNTIVTMFYDMNVTQLDSNF
jgi:hypothetical protein